MSQFDGKQVRPPSFCIPAVSLHFPLSPQALFLPVVSYSLSSLTQEFFHIPVEAFLPPECIFFLICIAHAYSSFLRCLLITSYLHPHTYELIAAILCSPNSQGFHHNILLKALEYIIFRFLSEQVLEDTISFPFFRHCVMLIYYQLDIQNSLDPSSHRD